MSAPALPTRFDPRTVEARWQKEWDARAVGRGPDRPKGPTYCVILPPPNVTGLLTMGHMLGDTVMDILVRHHRMHGDATVWVPGLDHAGLATQVEVRRRLAKQGVRFEKLPREQALHEIERWKEEHERRILEQTRAGGFTVDWSRYRYTMDPGSTRATREVFVRLHADGLVYRGERMVNWDPRLQTAISDLEVVHTEEDGELYYLRYPWADGTPGGLEVATVRPETIFGDVAVAVHPSDERYRSWLGREVIVPLTDRTVPIIEDAAIDPGFGAGALKVTPRNDLVDHEVFQRHPTLPMPPDILDDSGHLTGDWVPPAYRGLDRDEARTKSLEDLEKAGLLLRREPYRHSVARSERSDAVIEPRLSTQWFVRMRSLAEPVLEAVRRGEIRIHPARWEREFFRWLEGIQDWCISRQVLWGHTIPVYHCRVCRREIVAVEPPKLCDQCSSPDLEEDPEVLDTWFTSWLWPFLTLGWPERTADLEHYYPTSVLVTGRDIMFFWVARMMMAGYYFRNARPFSDVYFTGMIRDEQGRRMSKHLGNSPDPLDVIRERGADAMRFALVFPNPSDEDGPFGSAALDGGRNFLTKVWNLGRFTLSFVPPGTAPPAGPPALPAGGALENRWILSRYRHAAEEVDRALAEFRITQAATTLYDFLWHDLADRYVEIAKEALTGRRGEPAQREARETLLFVVERSLRLLHPFVPHVTEELWHALPHPDTLLALSAWPRPDEAPADPVAEVEMEPVLETVRLLRNLRSEEKVPLEARPKAWVRPTGSEAARVLRAERETVVRLVRLGSLDFLGERDEVPPSTGRRVAVFGECFIERPVASGATAEALAREREKLVALLEKTRARLADPGFRDRAPRDVVREAEEKATELA
ncbi:MAG TPA: valine--tRNA ligase, partial [Thermoplasmata archaeon]|nr:valine--tRNA ligase [Thermoplasmata archaeon]